MCCSLAGDQATAFPHKAQEACPDAARPHRAVCGLRAARPREPPGHTVLTPSGSEVLRQRLSRRMLPLSSDFLSALFSSCSQAETHTENLPVHSPNAWVRPKPGTLPTPLKWGKGAQEVGPSPAAPQDALAGAAAEEAGKLTGAPAPPGWASGQPHNACPPYSLTALHGRTTDTDTHTHPII